MAMKFVLILVEADFFGQLKDRHFLNININFSMDGPNCNETLFLMEQNVPQLANKRFVIMKPNEMGHRVCYRRITKLHSLCLPAERSYSMRSQTDIESESPEHVFGWNLL